MVRRFLVGLVFLCVAPVQHAAAQNSSGSPLPGTALLVDLPEDPAAAMVAGINRFSLKKIALSKEERFEHWSAPESKVENIDFLKSRLGLPRDRQSFTRGSHWNHPKLLYSDATCTISEVRWPVLSHPAPQLAQATTLWGEGLLVTPAQSAKSSTSANFAIVVPDADETAEAYSGLLNAGNASSQGQLVAQLVGAGVPVLLPQLVSRSIELHGQANLPGREYLHRSAFELGTTLVGYEIQMLQAAIDQFGSQQTIVAGFGEGGMLALYCGAVDERIDTTICCGYFGPRENGWQTPLSRNVFGLLERFGDAELGAMVAPRKFIVSVDPSYQLSIGASGAAPAEWKSPASVEVKAEFERMTEFATGQLGTGKDFAVFADSGELQRVVQGHVAALQVDRSHAAIIGVVPRPDAEVIVARSRAREARWAASIDAHSQALLEECDHRRSQFLNIGLERDNLPDGTNAVDTTSEENYAASIADYREQFTKQIIGQFDDTYLPLKPRTRQSCEGANWTGYDVVLDVFDDVFAYGVLLLPNGMQPNERRPVVVCQHGLEGRPQDTIAGDHYAYHDFAARLAERGFIVFAPQNPYIGQDQFRTLQRKLNPLGKTLFSVIGPQHAQILKWLSSLPMVDSERIAFYGLSYGGKSAMRLPAMLPQYCLSICSADFNDWVWKNASSRSPYSYVGTGEYEIFEFNLGQTFNYAEMAALIAPRPFMVERGHFDGVAPDDRVAKEFARVRFLYAARLGVPERCEIEWFNGPHTIYGQGTFDFLHKHLNWPKPTESR